MEYLAQGLAVGRTAARAAVILLESRPHAWGCVSSESMGRRATLSSLGLGQKAAPPGLLWEGQLAPCLESPGPAADGCAEKRYRERPRQLENLSVLLSHPIARIHIAPHIFEKAFTSVVSFGS